MVAIGTYSCFVTCKSEPMTLRSLAAIVVCINEPLFDSTIPNELKDVTTSII